MAGLPLREARRLLTELTRAHLLAEPTPGRFAFHDLLRAYAAERAQADDSEAERRAATHRMLDHYVHTAHLAAMLLHPSRKPVDLSPLEPGVEPERLADAGEALAWLDAERRVLMAAAAQALEAGFDAQAWQIPWAQGRYLDLRGFWHDMAVNELTALAASQRLGDRSAQASSLQRAGLASARLGDYEAAHAHLQQALGIYTELGDLSGQGAIQHALAAACKFEGRDADALGHAQQALAAFTAAGDQAGQVVALGAVAALYGLLGDYRQSLDYGRQALDLYQGLDYPQAEAGTWDSLGYAHHHLGDHAEAAACYRRALGLRREIGDRWGQAETLGHIGDAQLAAGQPGEARAAWEEALAILDDLGHPEAGRVRAKLAELDGGSGA
jgi:tetratricopeptide (TPR) repeat protein